MNLSEVQTFQELSVWLRVRPDDVDEALIWIIGERHHQRVREEMAAYLNDKMAMRALAAHSAAPSEREAERDSEIARRWAASTVEGLVRRNIIGRYMADEADARDAIADSIKGALHEALSQDKPTVPK